MTSVGMMASAVHIPATCTHVLEEPFTNISAWATAGTPTVVAGRNGNAAQCAGTAALLRYTIPSVSESDTITVGFAWRKTDALTTARDILNLESDAGGTLHNQLIYTPSSTRLAFFRGASSQIANVDTVTFTQNTWYYIEVQAKLHDSAGFVVVKVNGTTVINSTGLDTRNAGTKATYDRVVVRTDLNSATGQWDDLYISTGGSCAFKGDHVVP